MKKILKNTSKLLLCALVFTLTFVCTVSAAPSKITIREADYTRDFLHDGAAGMTMFTTNDGTVVYCMDIDKKPLTEGMEATLSNDADAGVLYILKNGYPKKTYTNNRGMDAYITQMALWWYISEDKLSSDFKNATSEVDPRGLVTATKNLVNAARSAKDNSTKPTIKATATNTKLELTSDKKYYESSYLSATVTGTNTYNVEINGATKNTTVVDESGNIGTTMNSGEKFKVRVPASEVTKNLSISVKFKATGSVQKAKVYVPSDRSTYQRVVGLYTDNITVNDNINLMLNKSNKHICEFTDNKYYGKEGKEVDKKTFYKECNPTCQIIDNTYYGKSGNKVDKATYEKECGQEVVVPNTGANMIFWLVGLGVLAIAGGVGFIIYADKKNNKKA